MAESIVISEVVADLVRIQEFDPESLVQKEKLGIDLAFDRAVDPAKRLILLFQKLPGDALLEFAFDQANNVQRISKEIFNLFDQILKFKATVANAEGVRQNLISQLNEAYQPTFNALFPLISYAVARKVDFNALAAEGRVAVQSIRDETEKVVNDLKETSASAAIVLKEVREAAAEQGVTQQAKYFADEAVAHKATATKWMYASIGAAIVVLGYAVLTLFFTKIPALTASTPAEAVQLTASKFLVFFVLVYALFQCVRNYSANTHNAIVNKHRQNSLMTYKTLSEAGGSAEAREVVLLQAASAIYAPSDTGYVKHEDRGGGEGPIINFASKLIPNNLPNSSTP